MDESVPGAAGRGGFGTFRAVPPVVAPGAGRAGARREHLVVAVGGQAVAHPLVGGGALLGDVLGAAQVPGQRLLGVRPGDDVAGGQVVQLHPVAGPPQRAPGGQRVQRQGHRAARVVRGQQVPSGLVIHDDELGPGVEAVDPPGDRDLVRAGRDRPFHAERLVGRVEPGDVALHHGDGALALAHRLGLVREALVDPAAVHQGARGRDGALGQRQPPPAGQGVVHGGAEAVVRPRRPLGRRRPVQVAHPVPARAVQPGGQPGRRAGVEPPRHPLEAQLLHRE